MKKQCRQALLSLILLFIYLDKRQNDNNYTYINIYIFIRMWVSQFKQTTMAWSKMVVSYSCPLLTIIYINRVNRGERRTLCGRQKKSQFNYVRWLKTLYKIKTKTTTNMLNIFSFFFVNYNLILLPHLPLLLKYL